jgi:demethylmenaquinone methyltransferase/2-methoxy-6-polyprenyl-1,4-benzoquinol methylase
MIEKVKPYSPDLSKKEQVKEMFNNISQKYDFANTILSFGIHHIWRKKCVNVLKKYQPKIILDLATGTADLAIAFSQLHPEKIIAADFAEKMLQLAGKKIQSKNLSSLIEVKKEDGENLTFNNETFDAVTIAFGIRNFENYKIGLSEMYRVLKPQGILLILEFTMPRNFIMKGLYSFYFKFILPIIAWIITKDKRAYDYLPNSVKAFPQYEEFCSIIKNTGFIECSYIPLTGGIASIYIAKK